MITNSQFLQSEPCFPYQALFYQVILQFHRKQKLFCEKGFEIYIADFKGGVDFYGIWKRKCNIITQQEQLINRLEYIALEPVLAKQIFPNLNYRLLKYAELPLNLSLPYQAGFLQVTKHFPFQINIYFPT